MLNALLIKNLCIQHSFSFFIVFSYITMISEIAYLFFLFYVTMKI